MTSFTRAEDTVVRLHDAMRAGVPVMIAGALEIRARQPPQRPSIDAAAVGFASAPSPDRGRLEHEREGGGAPSQRNGRSHGILARLAHWVLYPSDLPIIWRDSLEKR